MQFFAEFFTVLKILHSERNHHFLMSLVRNSSEISTNGLSYQSYADLLTPYAINHLQGELKKMECVKVLQQI